eukprot:1731795-Pyramimonas_sp.AAC.1
MASKMAQYISRWLNMAAKMPPRRPKPTRSAHRASQGRNRETNILPTSLRSRPFASSGQQTPRENAADV